MFQEPAYLYVGILSILSVYPAPAEESLLSSASFPIFQYWVFKHSFLHLAQQRYPHCCLLPSNQSTGSQHKYTICQFLALSSSLQLCLALFSSLSLQFFIQFSIYTYIYLAHFSSHLLSLALICSLQLSIALLTSLQLSLSLKFSLILHIYQVLFSSLTHLKIGGPFNIE